MSENQTTNLTPTATQKRELLRRLLREKAAAAGHPPGGSAEFPLSYGQRALWFLWELDRENTAYNVPFAARVCDPLDLPALRAALQTVIDRHATLRATFRSRPEGPVQVIHRHWPMSLDEVDAGTWS